MYIISKFRDYYDTAIGIGGVDKTLVYNREEIELWRKESLFKETKDFRNWRRLPLLKHILPYDPNRKNFETYFLIGFCGKTYLGYILTERQWDTAISSAKTSILYGNEIMEFFRSKIKNNKEQVLYLHDMIEKFHGKEDITPFVEFKVPCFVELRDETIDKLNAWQRGIIPSGTNKSIQLKLNPVLKEFEFFKLFDAFQAFQEIEMFLGGVLGRNEKELSSIPEEYRYLQHGFDKKWSFRNPDPPKRKQK